VISGSSALYCSLNTPSLSFPPWPSLPWPLWLWLWPSPPICFEGECRSFRQKHGAGKKIGRKIGAHLVRPGFLGPLSLGCDQQYILHSSSYWLDLLAVFGDPPRAAREISADPISGPHCGESSVKAAVHSILRGRGRGHERHGLFDSGNRQSRLRTSTAAGWRLRNDIPLHRPPGSRMSYRGMEDRATGNSYISVGI
jgi:hypothetical protein